MLAMCEPRYQGRTLTSWLQQCYETPLMETQRLAEAQAAVRAMPVSEVLSRLLKLVEARGDPVSPLIMAKSEEFHLTFLKWHSAEDFQQLGIAGFEALGTNGTPAIGELTKLLADDQHAFTALRCLIFIGTPAESAVAQALTNANAHVRYFATQQFGWMTGDTGDYLAHMKNCLNDPDVSVRFAAVQGIGLQTQAPDLAIPLLLIALRDKQDVVSSLAANCLADFGTNAIGTFLDLSNAVVSGSVNTARQALIAMVAIAPDKALLIVLKNFQSPDPRRRRTAAELLWKYPATIPEVQSAIQEAAADPDPILARKTKERITKQYLAEHPVESQFPDEPSYGGKRLGEWLMANDRDGKFSSDAEDALHHIGTNAIPALLERLVYVQPPFGLRAFNVNIDAVKGFIVLGEQAVPALPRLRALMDSTNSDIALHAMLATCGTGSNAVPILIEGLTNQFPEVRNEAAVLLTDGPLAQFADLRKPAIPLFVKLLKDPDKNVRMNATNELKQIDPEAAAKAGIK